MSKLLIVDDDPHIRELAPVFLQGEGFDTCRAIESRPGAGTTFVVSLPDKGHLMRVSVGEKGRTERPTEVDTP